MSTAAENDAGAETEKEENETPVEDPFQVVFQEKYVLIIFLFTSCSESCKCHFNANCESQYFAILQGI